MAPPSMSLGACPSGALARSGPARSARLWGEERWPKLDQVGPRARQGLVVAVAAAVAGPAPTRAAPPLAALLAPPRQRPDPAKVAALEQVRRLAQEAQTRFETADFAGAIELWTQAYAALPEDPEHGPQRSALAYQIAQACVEAYSIDPKLSYLRKATRLFESYLPMIDPQDRETAAEVGKTLDDLRRRIAEAEAEEARKREAEEAAQREAEAAAQLEAEEARRREAEAARRREEAARPADAPQAPRPRRTLAIAGGVTLGLGALGLGLMAYGLAAGAGVDRRGDAARAAGEGPAVFRELLAEGTRANQIAVGAGVVGGVLVVAGAALLGVGLARRSQGREVRWVPRGYPAGAGVVLLGRF